MKFKIGDRVKFLNNIGGGRIKGIIDKRTVNVEDEDGFDVPVLISELVLTDSESVSEGKKVNTKEEEVVIDEYEDIDADIILEVNASHEIVEDKSEPRISLALKPDNPSNFYESNLDLYLINDSNYKLLYNLAETDNYKAKLLKGGYIEAGSKILIWSFSPAKLQDTVEISFQGIIFKKGLFDIQDPINETIEFKPTKVRKEKSYSDTDYFHEKVLMFPLIKSEMERSMDQISNRDIEKATKEKERGKKKWRKIEPDKPSDIEEIDLHIEALLDSSLNMSNSEIIDVQMSRFETALEGGIKSKSKRMVFIHGVGNGKLKMELRKKLDRKYPKLQYQDASFKEYGYGATMVMFK